MNEKKLYSHMIYRGKVVDLYKDNVILDDGREAMREVVIHKEAVCILAINEGNLVLIRQYRHPIGKEILEIPAGIMEPGERPEEAALRELKEETGYSAGRIERLFSFFSSPGFTNEKLHLFLARDLFPGTQNMDPDEHIDVVEMKGEEIYDRVIKGEIEDAKTILAVLLYNNMQGN